VAARAAWAGTRSRIVAVGRSRAAEKRPELTVHWRIGGRRRRRGDGIEVEAAVDHSRRGRRVHHWFHNRVRRGHREWVLATGTVDCRHGNLREIGEDGKISAGSVRRSKARLLYRAATFHPRTPKPECPDRHISARFLMRGSPRLHLFACDGTTF